MTEDPSKQPENPLLRPEIANLQQSPPRFDLSIKNLILFNLLFICTAFTTWLVGGPWFAFCLLLILTAHEFGHYFACRKNDVDASLPNFIPAPPFFLVGTFGAFIRIKEPIPNRRALMEIGSWGPLAGFVVAVPVFIIGLFLSDVRPEMRIPGYNLGDSILTLVLSKLILGVTSFTENVTVVIHPVGYAGWFGLFITALNLLPVGQLDGGHIIFSMFHKIQSLLAKIIFVIILPLGMVWPGWFLMALLIILMGFKHPPSINDREELLPKHRMMGYISIVIFFITFIPMPIEYLEF